MLLKDKIANDIELIGELDGNNPKAKYLYRRLTHDIFSNRSLGNLTKVDADLLQSRLNTNTTNFNGIDYEHIFKSIRIYSTTGVNIVGEVGIKNLLHVTELSKKLLKVFSLDSKVDYVNSSEVCIKVCRYLIAYCEENIKLNGENDREFYRSLHSLDSNLRKGITFSPIIIEVKEIGLRYVELLRKLAESNKVYYYNPPNVESGLRVSNLFTEKYKENQYIDYLDYYNELYCIRFIELFYGESKLYVEGCKKLFNEIDSLDLPYNNKMFLYSGIKSKMAVYNGEVNEKAHYVISAIAHNKIDALTSFDIKTILDSITLAEWIVDVFTAKKLIIYCIQFADICSRAEGHNLPKAIIFNTTLKLCLDNIEDYGLLNEDYKEQILKRYRRES